MLFDAIERGDAGTVWQQVQRGIQFDQIDESTELTPLALAAEAGHAEIVRILLSAGASPDLGGATTPLEAAVVGGHQEVVEALILHDADVNKAVEEGFTPLMTAAATGDLELVRILLNAGARSRIKNDDGDTAITLAEDEGHFGVAVVLRARRSRKAPTPNKVKESPPPAPATKKDLGITNSELATIVRETKEKPVKPPEMASLASQNISSATNGTKDQLQALQNTASPTPTAKKPAGLHEMVANSGTANEVMASEVAEDTLAEDTLAEDTLAEDTLAEDTLAEDKVTPNTEPTNEVMAHENAEPKSSVEVPPSSQPAEPEEEIPSDRVGAPELQEALNRLRTLLAQGIGRAKQALRDSKPDPQFTDSQGYTLLMAAAYSGEVEIVRLLLAAGANAAQCDTTDDGFSALIWAIRSPSEQRIEVLKTLAEAGADPDQRCGPNHRTPLMFAAQADVYLDRPEGPSFANTTRTLVELGADTEAQDRRGLTVWRLIKRDALGAPTFGASRRRLHHMVRVLEYCGAQSIESHAV